MPKNKLTLHMAGSSSQFVNYLKDFQKISRSLLLEIDPFNRQFIAKTFSENRNAIKFSAISFDDCNMQISAHEQADELKDLRYRIKLGILVQLPKIISIIERFESDAKDENSFDIIINYDVLRDASGGVSDFIAETIQFNSSFLTMKMDGFRPAEFRYLPDDQFNNSIFKLTDSVDFLMPSAVIASVIKTSDIVKIDPNKDTLVFYVEGKDVYVKDYTGKDKSGKDNQSNFVYKIGELDAEPGYPVRVMIFRNMFIQFLDKSADDYTVFFGKSVNGAVDRLCMQTVSDKGAVSKVVISVVNED